MKIAYFDCFAGVSGDMTLGALVDLGVEPAVFSDAVRSLGLDGFRIELSRVDRGNLGGTKVDVVATGKQPARNLDDIRALLGRGTLTPAVREQAGEVFQRIAEAESRAHRVPIEAVHFHEVGALDAIVDVVGACAGLAALGVERVACSPVVVGRGMTTAAHGPIPIPAPATVEILRGIPVREGPVEAEMTTPTGAALVATLAQSFGPMPDLRILAAGYGAGSRELAALPNLLRIVLGETDDTDLAASERLLLVEANLDDLSPQVVAHTAELLRTAGALDVWTTPVTMKKGRAGVVLSALVRPGAFERLEEILFRETTTLGIRRHDVVRRILERRHDEVETGSGRVRVKVGLRKGVVLTATPELEDCRALALASGVPLKEIQAQALAAWRATAPVTIDPERGHNA